MLEFCRRQVTTRQGNVRVGLTMFIVFVISMLIGFLVLAQPYAVYATGEKVEEPYALMVDGQEVCLVDSPAAAEQVILGLRMEYAQSFEDQQDAEILNTVTVEKYSFDKNHVHPVVMNGPQAVDYIVRLNAASEKPVIGVVTYTIETDTVAIPYDTVTVEDDELDKGEIIIETEGEEGVKTVTERVRMVSGKHDSCEVLSETVEKEPVTEVVIEGTREEPVIEEIEEEPVVEEIAEDNSGSNDEASSGSSETAMASVPATGGGTYLGNFRVTYFCCCCGGPHTASGRAIPGYSVASCDLPLGTVIELDGQEYRVDDICGIPGTIDILQDGSNGCHCSGVWYGDVYIK